MSGIDNTLKEIFGFDKFKPGQKQVVETIMAGTSAASIFPTARENPFVISYQPFLSKG
ncbi:MAG: hypothetical protein KKD21_06865 [Proteobacteria bacterium]|nr:hypothetical protein [Pseudomonadota bacterium]MBU1696753.1 hypothetical protein [Pseudomonadota bacterium]